MPFGLFGKMPQKRDFLSVNLPTGILNPFETWLQSAISSSRSEIGRNWENYYLVAPIWRFWLGREILGTGITGSLMPSVDQVGRYFPLAIIYYAGPGETLVPPLVNPVEDWYAAIEQRLLSVLAENAQVDPGSLLGGLRPPDYSSPPPMPVMPAPPRPAPVEPVEAPPAVEPVQAASAAGNGGAAWDDAPAPGPAAEPAATPEPLPEPAEAPAGNGAAEPATGARSAEDDFDWSPEPMAADRLAELDRIAAASFAPDSVWAKVGEAAPDASDGEAPAEAARDRAEAPPVFPGSMWDDAAGDAAPAAAAGAEPGPIAVLSRPESPAAPGDPEAAADAAEMPPEPEFEPPPAEYVEEPEAPQPPPVEELPPPPPLEVFAADFKGGLMAAIEGGNGFIDALPRLMALDIEHTAQTRGYWWCGPSSSGGPRLYAKSGMPDPYFYSRMLMWTA